MVFDTIRVYSNFLLVLYYCHCAQAEVFTAQTDVEHLLETQQRVIDDVNEYIALEEKRLMTLKKRINVYKEEHEKAMRDIPNYSGNPINAFTLIKRLTTDLELIQKDMDSGSANIKNVTKHNDVKYPTAEDVIGAAVALMRLKQVYKLDIKELSEGILNGVAYSTPLTAGDCYDLGLALYFEGENENALPWFEEAQRKYKDSELNHFSESDIMSLIGATHYHLGDYNTALKAAINVLTMNPMHPNIAHDIQIYQKAIAGDDENIEESEEIENNSTETRTSDAEYIEYLEDEKNYEILCRGEMDVAPVIAKSLYCRYVTEHHPFLRLAPLKVEFKYLQPDIVIFHDVIYEAEIQFLQEAAKPRFSRAVIYDHETGEMVPSKYRISKAAWFDDEESEIVSRITQRIADMTGLSMETAENLQVVNYGIGGHYAQHYDFTTNDDADKDDFENGNRIATVLFYMSEVTQGGATVFPKIGLSLFPIKGAAAFWLNLHPSGEGDLATRHAACPVLRGSKWVSNKWLHLHSQEFLRPCNLEYQEEGILRKPVPKPVIKTSR
ncbi:hypothetical protein ABMA28_002223 [Loxostege sticticalis]|uniref:procollagen-proline 4-dioxygenase n=1 Tax=Loxostege sticticalis TaxID=481309 RepID=A0ABD0T061_LOXSC